VADLTAAQTTRAYELALTLRAVRAGEVWQEPDGTSVETLAVVFGVSDPIGERTEEMCLAEAAGLVRAVPLRHGPGGHWELTPAGEKALGHTQENS
jgi:hypothetical protein